MVVHIRSTGSYEQLNKKVQRGENYKQNNNSVNKIKRQKLCDKSNEKT